jgi:hypothetical protein
MSYSIWGRNTNRQWEEINRTIKVAAAEATKKETRITEIED